MSCGFLIEVKSGKFCKRYSALDWIFAVENYGIDYVVVLTETNVERAKQIRVRLCIWLGFCRVISAQYQTLNR